MYLQAVCIDHLRVTAHGREIKAMFSFLDEVLHLASAAVKLNNLIWRHFHRGDNEFVQMYHLAKWLLNLEDDSSRMWPATSLIEEFTVFDSIVDLVIPCRPIKRFIRISCVTDQRGVLFQPNRIFAIMLLAGIVQFRCGKPLSLRK